MAGKREENRLALKQRLVRAAERQMAELGLKGLRAREIAEEAGCALGSVYTVFKDLDDLALHVNLRTVSHLDKDLAQAQQSMEDAESQLVAMADSYHHFAMTHKNLWVALFDHQLYGHEELPKWYQERHIDLFTHVEQSLQALCPDSPRQLTQATARTLFSAVHGIVSINMQARFIAVPEKQLTQQLHDFLHAYIKGLKAQKG